MEVARRNWKYRLLDFLPERLRIAACAAHAFHRKTGRWPNLIRPRDFGEMVQARKVWDRDPRLPPLADKVLVKDYVRRKLGDDWLIPTLWHGRDLPPASACTWPFPFVIKSNIGSGWNIFVRDDASCDWPAIRTETAQWMSTPFGRELGEWLYSRIEPQILVEPFLSRDDRCPLDFKFFVFNGRVEFIYVVTGRRVGHAHDVNVTFFTRDWRRLPYKMSFPIDEAPIAQPTNLAAMIEAAECLAQGISFVRVDLYEIDGKPLFGELTFYPSSGMADFSPDSFSRELMHLWRGATAALKAG
jgi:hypothetical protein